MRRMVGTTGMETGSIDGPAIRRALEQMEMPTDPVRSDVLFEQVMAKVATQQRRHRRVRQIAQVARAAIAAVMTGAGAYRLLTL